MEANHVCILGVRGVPAQHGGFETFAEYLSKYLVRKGWRVVVYCQEDGSGNIYETDWEGVRRVHIPVSGSGSLSTIVFDFKSILHSLRFRGVFLTLGYNTSIFNVIHRIYRKVNIINMDGIEWKREKWSPLAKSWFWVCEFLGCRLGNHLVADHPIIKNHLARWISRKKITMIPYGGALIEGADVDVLNGYGLVANEYAVVIARPEPENSILEIVQGFSERKRGIKLVVLGRFDGGNRSHSSVIEAASDEVLFLGAIYDSQIVSALRYFALCYVHGHQVGGTNPSLVEAIGAGNAVVAHDNSFNRWVAKDGALYFDGSVSFGAVIDNLISNTLIVERLKNSSRKNFEENFRWSLILSQYEELLLRYYPSR